MSKEIFIAIEGIDGSGKSTQAQLLHDYFNAINKPSYLTCEPTKSPIGSMIRNIFSHKQKADQHTIAGLFVADRLEHILEEDSGMLAQLALGKVVITDRYYFSSYAYHSVHVDMDWVIAANAMSAKILKPTVNIFVDIDPEIAMNRILANRQNIEMYETLENLIAVRNNYLKAFDLLKEKENIIIINGNDTPNTVHTNIIEAIKKYLS